MAEITNYKEFIENLTKMPYDNYIKRFRELAGMPESELKESYLIVLTFDSEELLLEHNNIKNFKKTTNRYYYHPEETHPPVKAHYHVIPRNGKNELYAVNMDGTAHHQKNKGHKIPNKEAKELRDLGVQIPKDNIIEYLDSTDLNNDLILEIKENNSELWSAIIEIKTE